MVKEFKDLPNHFYQNEPNVPPVLYTGEQKQIVNQLTELMGNIDEVLSAKSRFENIAKD